MRRSGSSSCLLRPKGSFNADELTDQDPLRVTMVTTKRLPHYSIERYYMLSEIEEHSQSIRFLDDYYYESIYHRSAIYSSNGESSSSSSSGSGSYMIGAVHDENYVDGGVVGSGSGNSDNIATPDVKNCGDNGSAYHQSVSERNDGWDPSHVVLYLLWRPNTYNSPREFVQSVVVKAVSRLLLVKGGKQDDNNKQPSETVLTPPSSPRTTTKTLSSLEESAESSLFTIGTPPPTSEKRSPPNNNDTSSSSSPSVSSSSSPKKNKHHPSSPSSSSSTTTPPPPPIKIYLVIDKVSRDVIATSEVNNSNDNDNDNDSITASAKEAHHAVETKIAEDLARLIAQSTTLRPLLEGTVIGTTSEPRAAPALETILSIVTKHAPSRRRITSHYHSRRRRGRRRESSSTTPSSSSIIDVVTLAPDDLTGCDTSGDTDAVNNLCQSVTCAEWGGNGDAISFAGRAFDRWRCELRGGGDDDDVMMSLMEGRRDGGGVTNGNIGGGGKVGDCVVVEGEISVEDVATMMAIGFLGVVGAYLWVWYGDLVVGFFDLIMASS